MNENASERSLDCHLVLVTLGDCFRAVWKPLQVEASNIIRSSHLTIRSCRNNLHPRSRYLMEKYWTAPTVYQFPGFIDGRMIHRQICQPTRIHSTKHTGDLRIIADGISFENRQILGKQSLKLLHIILPTLLAAVQPLSQRRMLGADRRRILTWKVQPKCPLAYLLTRIR